MRKERMRRYVDALRSGDYRQIRHVFRKSHGGCCAIGVGLNLMVEEGLGVWKESITPGNLYYQVQEESEAVTIHGQVQEWLELEESLVPIIVMNDEKEMSFEEIAEYLEIKYLTGTQ